MVGRGARAHRAYCNVHAVKAREKSMASATKKCSMCSEVCAEARKCGLCVQRRTPNPAYYCSEACAKRHWKEHKAWHAQVKQDVLKDIVEDELRFCL